MCVVSKESLLLRAKDKEFGTKKKMQTSLWILSAYGVIWLFRELRLEPWLRDDLGRKGRVVYTWALLWLLVSHRPMSKEEYQCVQEKEVISVCFPPEEDESRVFLLFICPEVPKIWDSYILDLCPPNGREEKDDGITWGGDNKTF